MALRHEVSPLAWTDNVEGSDLKARTAAFEWLVMLVEFHDDVLPWSALKEGFPFEGERVHVISQQGIFNPSASALGQFVYKSSARPHTTPTTSAITISNIACLSLFHSSLM